MSERSLKVGYLLDWLKNQPVIACRVDSGFVGQILTIPTQEMLNEFPEAYFVGSNDMPPSMPMPGYIEVSVRGKVGFDLRNISDLQNWKVIVDGGLPQPIPEDTGILELYPQATMVTFLSGSGEKLIFKLFYEEKPPVFKIFLVLR
jgi:hypothetical protein